MLPSTWLLKIPNHVRFTFDGGIGRASIAAVVDEVSLKFDAILQLASWLISHIASANKLSRRVITIP